MGERRAEHDPRAGTDRLEGLSAVTGLVAVMGVGVATLATGVPDGIGPEGLRVWAWWSAFALYLAVFLLDAFVVTSARANHALVVVQLAAGCGVVAIAPDGWSGVVLVVTAVSVAYSYSVRVIATVVAFQTAVIAVGVANAGWTTTEVAITTVTYGSFQAFAALVTLSRRREVDARAELAAAHEQLERAHAELRATTALLAASTRSAERLRIARDLHDLVGHQLTALALELEVASHDGASSNATHVARARQVAKDLLRDVRAAVGELRAAPQGLEPALREVVRDLPGLRVELEVVEDLPVDDDQALTVLRSVQELVTNTLRHADATTLHVRVVADASGVTLHTRDDGRGARGLVPGNGLHGLRERIEQQGGQVEVDPGADGTGFCVDARLPVP